jgi:hypothetical protein
MIEIALQSLRCNDRIAGDDIINIYLGAITSAYVPGFVEAMLLNTCSIRFSLRSYGETSPTMKEADWAVFWNTISNSSFVYDIELDYGGTHHTDRFLDSVARSTSIKTVHLRRVTVNVDSLRTFLRTTTSVTKLQLQSVTFAETLNPAGAADDLMASIAANTSIEVLQCSS